MLTNMPSTKTFPQVLQSLGSYYLKTNEIFITTEVILFSNGTYNPVVQPGNLIVKDPNIYNDNSPESTAIITALTNYLAEIVSFLAFDTVETFNQETFENIRRAVRDVIDFEKRLAAVIVNTPNPPNDMKELEKLFKRQTIGDLAMLIGSVRVMESTIFGF